MPFGIKPVCNKCSCTESSMWFPCGEGQLCNDCHSAPETVAVKTEEEKPAKGASSQEGSNSKLATRKSSRTTRNLKSKANSTNASKAVAPKGKGRRAIFKKVCTKAPSAVATPVTSNYVFYKGSYYQVGDIVAMRDVDGDLYYAQLRGLCTDQYCEKSAAVTWLIPTQDAPHPEEGFDPATYILGPDEDILRKLDCMEFIMHAPSDYYKDRTTPFPPTGETSTEGGFIWTRLPSTRW